MKSTGYSYLVVARFSLSGHLLFLATPLATPLDLLVFMSHGSVLAFRQQTSSIFVFLKHQLITASTD
jgi:hypothetical protein